MSKRIYLDQYQRPSFKIESVELIFDIQDDHVMVGSQLHIVSEVNEITLHQENLAISGLSKNGLLLSTEEYVLTDSSLVVKNCQGEFNLSMKVRLEPEHNKALSGLYASEDMLCTQCEAEGFRRIVPFLDQPDNLAKFTTQIIACKTKYPVLLAGGNLIASENLPDGRHTMTFEDPFPKPSYLFALVTGQLIDHTENFKTISGRHVRLSIYTRSADVGKTHRAMKALIEAMRWDEQAYGREYDLDQYNIVAVDDFNMGAMENKGLNIFNSKYVLADPKTTTDTDNEFIDAIVGHEYFHNWTGNRVTVENWFYLSLKEGLTVFREQEFSAHIAQSPATRIEQVRLLKAKQFKEDRGPMSHAVIPRYYEKIDNFYTLTIYEKGSEIIRMLKQMVGENTFRAGMDHYFEMNDGKAVSIQEFLDAIAHASGQDLTHFSRWYDQSGTPKVQVEVKNTSGSELEIHLKQINPQTPDGQEKTPLFIPLNFALYDQNTGKQIHAPSTVILDDQNKVLKIQDITQPAVLTINRNFSAPVEIEWIDDHVHNHHIRIRCEDDPYVRWDSAMHIWFRELHQLITLEEDRVVSDEFLSMIEFILHSDLHPSLKALMLSAPAVDELMGQLSNINVDIIRDAYERIFTAVALRFGAEFQKIDQQYVNALSDSGEDVALRQLQAICFHYLAYSQQQSHLAWVNQRYRETENLTLRLAALRALTGSTEFCQLDHFYNHHAQHNQHLLQKWWAIQARSWRGGVLSRLKQLMKHEKFNINNPNSLSSLVGVFCEGNPLVFHSQGDDNGYAFLKEVLLVVDQKNPQMSAKLAKAFHTTV